MSIEFTKTKARDDDFKRMNERFNFVSEKILPYADKKDLAELENLQKKFNRQISDFYREDRKLNIGVIGRVKAGKSTFLNMLIFNGKEILPRAFTPKTATLTKIEYSSENSIEVEYYSAEEWNSIKALAKSDIVSEEINAAKELVEATERTGINVDSYTAKKREIILFESENNLIGELNRYVGENGEVTPLVKCVTLFINKPELEGISIVDTPGLNDPVVSRTDRTRQFLEKCDTAFFLSVASRFLDKNDFDLLRLQLPSEGLTKLALICSRFDEALIDANEDYDSISENVADSKRILGRDARTKFTEEKRRYEKIGDKKRANLMAVCEKPIFVSSIFHGMIGRDYDNYNELEKHSFDKLNEERDDLDEQAISEIGDIYEVEKWLSDVIAEKDDLLSERAKDFVPLALSNLTNFIGNLRERTEKHLNTLANNETESLEKQRKEVKSRIHNIQAKIEEYFGTVSIKMNEAQVSILRDLRRDSHEYSQLQDKTGTETHFIKTRVSDSTWYKPWTWGSSHTEISTYQTTYTYVDVSDALENIRKYANSAGSSIEEGFIESTDVPSLKNNLLNIVINNFDVSDENYDPAYFRLLTEGTLSKINIPVIKINVEDYLSSMSSRFSGEIRDSSKRSELRSLLSSCISQLFDKITEQFTHEIEHFKAEINQIKDGFSAELLKDINDDFNKILKECENKEAAVAKLQNYLDVLKNCEVRL